MSFGFFYPLGLFEQHKIIEEDLFQYIIIFDIPSVWNCCGDAMVATSAVDLLCHVLNLYSGMDESIPPFTIEICDRYSSISH